MPQSLQEWPFPNRTILGLDKTTPVCNCFRPWSRLLNRHRRVVRPWVWSARVRKSKPC
ncbi:hypothetical protein F383_12566 [Gossypium arboreum]|uniref:Uncharacterized protein n=1 Tax=Gossypium arboreum TaxID=29729 RepID=A0A0B0PY42_GOSAR|nr:hypothetical protein F383_12566 [Gossypium arboreum]